jgi:hypothetical protein
MCLIKGKEEVQCNHMTCARIAAHPEALEHTRRNRFTKRNDFRYIKLHRNALNNPGYIDLINPHKESSNAGSWQAFEDFKRTVSVQAMGDWPKGVQFHRDDIDIQFFLYARKIGTYNPLTENYDYKLVLDVDEAAVFSGIPI